MLLPSALKPALRRNSMYFLGMRAAQGWVHFTMFVKSGWVPSVVLQLVNTSLNQLKIFSYNSDKNRNRIL